MESTWGFVTWGDVTSGIVEGERGTLYYMPSQPMQGRAGNVQRLEVRSFRVGRVESSRDSSARIYIEFIKRGARNRRAGVQRSHPNLVILAGWGHPEPPSGWLPNGDGSRSEKWPWGAPEWRAEMDTFLTEYLRDNPTVRVLVDTRGDQGSTSTAQRSPVQDQFLPPGPIPASPTGNLWEGATLDWVGGLKPIDFATPDEVLVAGSLTEGAVKRIHVNAYERNPEARRRCLEHFGSKCIICRFDFGETYGDTLSGYIHVHHLKPLSEIGSEYVIDPIADLRPVCPNCHAVIRSREPPYTINEVRVLLGAE